MAEPRQYSWQQQPGESAKAFGAFVLYRNMEPRERSLQRVASELTKSSSLIRRWSSRWDWQTRVARWDDYQEMRRLETLIKEKQKMDAEHLKVIRSARSKAIKALADMKPEQLATNPSELRRWITESIRYERLIMGEPETTEGRREKIEVQATLEERLLQYAPVFQELLDEGAIHLDGHHDQPTRENGEYELVTYDGLDDE